jgi:hypothetical protein
MGAGRAARRHLETMTAERPKSLKERHNKADNVTFRFMASY